jgi:flavin reductase (DIM6/NTAB) family NADH-FMN oxidoreductase RutF
MTEAAVDPQEFRRALGQFATGVVVVCSMLDGTPYGLAVNSFTSVSLDPPLVAFCADKHSSTWPNLRASGRFSVSVLAETQQDVCKTFAAKGADRFASLSWSLGVSGSPRLDGALTWLDCEIESIHTAGDHDLVLGRVVAMERSAGRPLVFFGGAFGRLAEPPPAATEREAEAAESLSELAGLDVESPFFAVLSSRLAAPPAGP